MDRNRVITFGKFGVAAIMLVVLAVLIDRLDFIARWLSHIEPYKDNLERIVIIGIVAFIVVKYASRVKDCVKNLKVSTGTLGFEVNLEHGDKDEGVAKKDTAVAKAEEIGELTKIVYANNGLEISRRILKVLSDEMRLKFSEDVMLRRGNCNYNPDGFAVKNGHAYIVEVKACDSPSVLKRSLARLRVFVQMMSDQIKDTTVVFCIYSQRPANYFRQLIESETSDLNADFTYRVFSREMLGNVRC